MIRSDSIQITPEILSLIARIDEFKGAWRALGSLAPDRLLALRRVELSDRDVERGHLSRHGAGRGVWIPAALIPDRGRDGTRPSGDPLQSGSQ